jgi:Ser/Thr protein kinase RdoA (MazF antagonist)
MKVDSGSIDRQALCQLLEEHYGLSVISLDFVPGGEESHGYVIETAARSRHFCKVYENASELSTRYKAANRLHTQCGLEFVVHPYATGDGEFHAQLGERDVGVYDWVDGTASDPGAFSDRQWKQVARLTARLHQSVQCPALPVLPVERFEIWFEDWLGKVLDAAEETKPLQHRCEREARGLLAREKDSILETMGRLKQLAEHARTTGGSQVLTHGDLNPENLLWDDDSNLHIIDWSKIAIGPPERDLIHFCGKRFEVFLEEYVRHCDEVPRLCPALFTFCSLFLALWAIADYGSWILLEDGDVAEKEHAWAALQQYLPVDQNQVDAERIEQAIEVFWGTD